jgi:hypothetical protein
VINDTVETTTIGVEMRGISALIAHRGLYCADHLAEGLGGHLTGGPSDGNGHIACVGETTALDGQESATLDTSRVGGDGRDRGVSHRVVDGIRVRINKVDIARLRFPRANTPISPNIDQSEGHWITTSLQFLTKLTVGTRVTIEGGRRIVFLGVNINIEGHEIQVTERITNFDLKLLDGVISRIIDVEDKTLIIAVLLQQGADRIPDVVALKFVGGGTGSGIFPLNGGDLHLDIDIFAIPVGRFHFSCCTDDLVEG